MNFVKNLILYCRACAACGKSLGKVEWLCFVCQKRFYSQVSLKTRWVENKFQHFYLVDWRPEDQFLSTLAISLKGRGLTETYETLALLTAIDKKFLTAKSIYFHEQDEKDHGWQWGHTFSTIFNCELKGLKEPRWGYKQSLLNREQRKKRTFIGQPNRSGMTYFVDDILTTGSTALAAYKALNQPKNFAVWSLFYRRNL